MGLHMGFRMGFPLSLSLSLSLCAKLHLVEDPGQGLHLAQRYQGPLVRLRRETENAYEMCWTMSFVDIVSGTQWRRNAEQAASGL